MKLSNLLAPLVLFPGCMGSLLGLSYANKNYKLVTTKDSAWGIAFRARGSLQEVPNSALADTDFACSG